MNCIVCGEELPTGATMTMHLECAKKTLKSFDKIIRKTGIEELIKNTSIHVIGYRLELEFPRDKPDEELIKELTKLAFLRGASLNIVDEFYREKKVQT